MEEHKRLFIAAEIVAPWPETLPEGRTLSEESRHLTLEFLGNVLIPELPKPDFKIGFAGIFDKVLFLTRVAAWHIHFLEETPFTVLPHVTIARKPFKIQEWKESFVTLPCYTKNIRLYESLGHSHYKIIQEHPILAPFEPMEHTADLAFIIRGANWQQLYVHAWLALAFYAPQMCFVSKEVNSLADIVEALNGLICLTDIEKGCPFKAVSYHGQFHNEEWEMIVDV